jgi:hypothetical protein
MDESNDPNDSNVPNDLNDPNDPVLCPCRLPY